MSWNRTKRQEAILHEKIAMIVLDRLNDPRLGFVTITAVELSKDKRYCTVTYTVLGSDSVQRTTRRALEHAGPRIQELLAPTLKMRLMPDLRFVFDAGVQKEREMAVLLDKIAEERAAEEAVRLAAAEAAAEAAGADGDDTSDGDAALDEGAGPDSGAGLSDDGSVDAVDDERPQSS